MKKSIINIELGRTINMKTMTHPVLLSSLTRFAWSLLAPECQLELSSHRKGEDTFLLALGLEGNSPLRLSQQGPSPLPVGDERPPGAAGQRTWRCWPLAARVAGISLHCDSWAELWCQRT